MEGDEIGVDVEGLAIDDELEGGRGVDTANVVRGPVQLKDQDDVPFAPVSHGVQIKWVTNRSLARKSRESWFVLQRWRNKCLRQRCKLVW